MKRRAFVKQSALGAFAASSISTWPAARVQAKIPLGMDAHAVRGMRWQAGQLIDYANGLGMRSLLLNGLDYFESLDNSHLQSLQDRLQAQGMRLYFGVGGLSLNSPSYSDRFGTPTELVREGIRIARIFNTPSVNCRIGSIQDRYTEGGIIARMEEISSVLRSMRSEITDVGIKFAIENHAGDMRSEELLQLVDGVGTDICGVMLDPGNSVWAMENPMNQLEMLGKHVLCTSIRDYRVWPSAGGAHFQWTALGEGSMDFKSYTERMAALCPAAPFHIESISGDAREIPFLTEEFWEGFPDLKASLLLDFFHMVRDGEAMEALVVPEGADKTIFMQNHQKNELKKSAEYLWANCAAIMPRKA
ncbi:MAG: TIM barrel protein [Bacteroidota bacterium]